MAKEFLGTEIRSTTGGADYDNYKISANIPVGTIVSLGTTGFLVVADGSLPILGVIATSQNLIEGMAYVMIKGRIRALGNASMIVGQTPFMTAGTPPTLSPAGGIVMAKGMTYVNELGNDVVDCIDLELR